MTQLPNKLLTLIAHLRKFPGVGRKTAERFAFSLMEWSREDLTKFSDLLAHIKEIVKPCSECGCLTDEESCRYCDQKRRDPSFLCLISSPRDVYAIEETHAYKGLYHVISGLLSPLDGRGAKDLALDKLKERVVTLPIKEVIIALDSTLEADATALYLKKNLQEWGLSTSRLAFGLPMGSSLDYVDYGTLERAFTGRSPF